MKMKKKIISLLIAIMAMLQVLPLMAQNIQQTPADKLFAQYREQYSQEAQVLTLDKSGIKDVYNSEEAKKLSSLSTILSRLSCSFFPIRKQNLFQRPNGI